MKSKTTIVPTSLMAAALLLCLGGCGASDGSSQSSVRVATTSAATSHGAQPARPPFGCSAKPTLTPEVAVVPLDSVPAIPIRVPFARAMARARRGQVWVVGYCASNTKEWRRPR